MICFRIYVGVFLLGNLQFSSGIQIALPGLSLRQQNSAAGSGTQTPASGNLLANVIGDASAGLNELSSMGLDLSDILHNNGGLSGLISTLSSNNQFVDMVRQMPMSDSLGKVLNLLKSTIPDITSTSNGGARAAINGNSQQPLLNREQIDKLLDQLSRPSSNSNLLDGLRGDSLASLPERASDAPHELVNNQSQQPQQFNNQNLQRQQSSQDMLMNRLDPSGQLQAPANIPLGLLPTQSQHGQFQHQAMLQQQLPPPSNPSFQSFLSSAQFGSGGAQSGNLASSNTMSQLMNQLSSSGILQNPSVASMITPELIGQLSSSGVLQNPQLLSSLISTFMNQQSSSQLPQGTLGPVSNHAAKPQLPVQVNQGFNFVNPSLVGKSPERVGSSQEKSVGLEPDELTRSVAGIGQDDDDESVGESTVENTSKVSAEAPSSKPEDGLDASLMGKLINFFSSS